MADIKLVEGESKPFLIHIRNEKGEPLHLLPWHSVRVFSHNPAAVRLTEDATPALGSIASGTLNAGKGPVADVAIQAVVTGGDTDGSNAVMLVDVGTLPPPAAPVKPVPPPVRVLSIVVPPAPKPPAAEAKPVDTKAT